jgi:multicomponent K+:H+ antiporter subunit F
MPELAPVTTVADPLSPAQWVMGVCLDLTIVVLFVGLVLCLYRLVRGPHLADRALAADTIAIHLVGLVLVLCLRSGTLLLLDGAIVLSLLGFVGTVAVAQYIARPHLRARPGGAVPKDKEGRR